MSGGAVWDSMAAKKGNEGRNEDRERAAKDDGAGWAVNEANAANARRGDAAGTHDPHPSHSHAGSGGARPKDGKKDAADAGSRPSFDATMRALLSYRDRVTGGPDPYVRQGGEVRRGTSPPWDLTSLRVRRRAARRFEKWRSLLALGERVPPHWQAFEAFLDELERALPPELRPLMRDDEDATPP